MPAFMGLEPTGLLHLTRWREHFTQYHRVLLRAFRFINFNVSYFFIAIEYCSVFVHILSSVIRSVSCLQLVLHLV